MEDEGGDWGNAATSQGHVELSAAERGVKDSRLQPAEGVRPC